MIIVIIQYNYIVSTKCDEHFDLEVTLAYFMYWKFYMYFTSKQLQDDVNIIILILSCESWLLTVLQEANVKQ